MDIVKELEDILGEGWTITLKDKYHHLRLVIIGGGDWTVISYSKDKIFTKDDLAFVLSELIRKGCIIDKTTEVQK